MEVTIDDTVVTIVGKITRVADIAIPLIELLTEDSKPTDRVPRHDALQIFDEHAERLARDQRSFTTALRGYWTLPYILWELKL